MPKTTFTPRDQLVCGKLDTLEDQLETLGQADLLDLVADIRRDCERMEAKLVLRRDEVATLSRQIAMLEDALRLQRNEAQAQRLASAGLVQHAQYLADAANAMRAELKDRESKLATLTELYADRDRDLTFEYNRANAAETASETLSDRLQDAELALDRACQERDRALADLAAALGGLVNAADLRF